MSQGMRFGGNKSYRLFYESIKLLVRRRSYALKQSLVIIVSLENK